MLIDTHAHLDYPDFEADFDDVLTWCEDDCWRISERRIVPVFRDPARAPVTS